MTSLPERNTWGSEDGCQLSQRWQWGGFLLWWPHRRERRLQKGIFEFLEKQKVPPRWTQKHLICYSGDPFILLQKLSEKENKQCVIGTNRSGNLVLITLFLIQESNPFYNMTACSHVATGDILQDDKTIKVWWLWNQLDHLFSWLVQGKIN